MKRKTEQNRALRKAAKRKTKAFGGTEIRPPFLQDMDIQLYFEKTGCGEPLILLHGNGEDRTVFAGQIPHFAKRFTVYAVDTRGHGKSPRGTKPFTLSQFADDLRDFLDEQGIEKTHVLGFSDGANIAVLFALRYPKRLLSLVLNSGNLDPDGLMQETVDEIRTAYAKAKEKRTEEERKEAALLELMLFEPQIKPESLSKIDVPTLVIAGDHDVIREEHTRLIAESIPNAELVILSGTHGVAEESPEAFNDALDRFYSKKCR